MTVGRRKGPFNASCAVECPLPPSDNIDRVLAMHDDLTDEELDFINYDLSTGWARKGSENPEE
jgi:hypothetical protein